MTNTLQQDYTEAQTILASLKTAYKDHITGRGATKRYKIKDREMEFANLDELLKQIRYWEQEVARLGAALGERPQRPRRIISQFR